MKTVTRMIWTTDPKTGAKIYRIKKFRQGDPDYEKELQAEKDFFAGKSTKSEMKTIAGKV